MTRTKCSITMYKVLKSEIYENFGLFIEHDPHWINFTILIFIHEKNRYYKCLNFFWNKLISFDMNFFKKKAISYIYIKGEFEILGVILMFQMG